MFIFLYAPFAIPLGTSIVPSIDHTSHQPCRRSGLHEVLLTWRCNCNPIKGQGYSKTACKKKTFPLRQRRPPWRCSKTCSRREQYQIQVCWSVKQNSPKRMSPMNHSSQEFISFYIIFIHFLYLKNFYIIFSKHDAQAWGGKVPEVSVKALGKAGLSDLKPVGAIKPGNDETCWINLKKKKK